MSEEEIKCLNNCGFANVTQLLLAYVSLQQENSQLKDNWNKLKEWASNFYNSEEVGWAGCGMRYTLEKIQEIEQGSDSNE